MYCFVCMPACRTQNWLCLDLSIHYIFGAETCIYEMCIYITERGESQPCCDTGVNYFISFCPNEKT